MSRLTSSSLIELREERSMASGSAEESSRWSVRRRLSRASEVEFFWRRGPLNLSRMDGGAGAIARLYAGAGDC